MYNFGMDTLQDLEVLDYATGSPTFCDPYFEPLFTATCLRKFLTGEKEVVKLGLRAGLASECTQQPLCPA